MILVKPSHKILEIMAHPISLNLIEKAGRTCYKSEDKITPDSAEKFVKMIRDCGHHSVIEHSALTVKFICDRGVTHELVRHRLCAFSQESTRYCNYKSGVTFVIPPWVNIKPNEYHTQAEVVGDVEGVFWLEHMLESERAYILLLKAGWSPQQARSVLPNSLKTEIVVTANFREWHHILTLRCSKAAHPQMQELMKPLLKELIKEIPAIFDDLKELTE